MECKAIIFDLDGVITNTAQYHYRAWKQLTDELGIAFDLKFNERLKGIDRMSSLEIILENTKTAYTEEEKREFADKKNTYYREFLACMTPEDILPGALRILKQVRNINIKTALASASKNASTVLDKLGIRSLFDYIADASQIKKNKPAPDIFLVCAKNLGISPRNCIGIEDSEAGIKAIKAANMYAVGIGSKATLKDADIVLEGLYELKIINQRGRSLLTL